MARLPRATGGAGQADILVTPFFHAAQYTVRMNSIECDLPVRPAPAPVLLWTTPATVQCGFPSPAEDLQREPLDIARLLVRQPDATYFVRVRGPSMRDAGIDEGDYVVVDRAAIPRHGSIVLAVVDGEFTIKRLFRRAGRVRLCAANPAYPDIDIKDAQELTIWGVVTWTLRQHASP